MLRVNNCNLLSLFSPFLSPSCQLRSPTQLWFHHFQQLTEIQFNLRWSCFVLFVSLAAESIPYCSPVSAGSYSHTCPRSFWFKNGQVLPLPASSSSCWKEHRPQTVISSSPHILCVRCVLYLPLHLGISVCSHPPTSGNISPVSWALLASHPLPTDTCNPDIVGRD